MKSISSIFLLSSLASLPAHAEIECIGEPSYRVCSESITDSNGKISIRSWDTDGNTYSVDTEPNFAPDGTGSIRSYDSEGNNYSIRSWRDSQGVHSEDSDGNRCTITPSGLMIGCGQ